MFGVIALNGCSALKSSTLHITNESTHPVTSIRITTGKTTVDIPSLERDHPVSTRLRGTALDHIQLSWISDDGTTRSGELALPRMLRGLDHYIIQFSADTKTAMGIYVITPKEMGYTSDRETQQVFDTIEPEENKAIQPAGGAYVAPAAGALSAHP